MKSLKLDRGLWLEDSRVLLPWNASGEELRRIGQPVVSEEADRLRLVWAARTCLGGLHCQIEAHLYREHKARKASLGVLRQLVVYPVDAPDESVDAVRAQYASIKRHLTRLLGEPTTEMDNYAGYGLPLCEWDTPFFRIVHMIFERFGEYVVTEVRTKSALG